MLNDSFSPSVGVSTSTTIAEKPNPALTALTKPVLLLIVNAEELSPIDHLPETWVHELTAQDLTLPDLVAFWSSQMIALSWYASPTLNVLFILGVVVAVSSLKVTVVVLLSTINNLFQFQSVVGVDGVGSSGVDGVGSVGWSILSTNEWENSPAVALIVAVPYWFTVTTPPETE